MDFLRQFSGRFVAAQSRRIPDRRMQPSAGAPWPDLAGVVGVFFSSRTGSTAMVRMASEHLRLGQVGEAFNTPGLEARARRWGLDSLGDTARRVVAEQSPAGWFMFKAGGPGVVNAARLGFLAHYAPVLHPVLLVRRDVLAQALSVHAAQLTRQYHSTQTAAAEMTAADYDAKRITQIIRTILDSNARLSGLADAFPQPPRLLIYEDFRNGDTATPLAVMQAIGVPPRPVPCPVQERVARNTHPLNADFHARFLAEAGPRARALLERHAQFVADLLARRSAPDAALLPAHAAAGTP